MGYSNPLHGLDHNGDRVTSDPGDTLPGVTADEHRTDDTLTNEARRRAPEMDDGGPSVGAVFVVDMAYLNQRILEGMANLGLALPAGVTVEALAEWRAAHPDYDPDAPLCGMPGAAEYVEPVLPEEAYGEIEVVGVAETVEPDEARCTAVTASPVDEARRCPVHPDGAHHCYRGPGHQHAARTDGGFRAFPGGFTNEPRPAPDGSAPGWANHWCDCGFAWYDVVAARVPRRDGQPEAVVRPGGFVHAGQPVLSLHVERPRPTSPADPWRVDRGEIES